MKAGLTDIEIGTRIRTTKRWNKKIITGTITNPFGCFGEAFAGIRIDAQYHAEFGEIANLMELDFSIINKGNIMELKEKLDALNWSQLHALWDVWIYQNSESPNEKAMIEDILNIAIDETAEAELCWDIDNIDKITQVNTKNTKLLDFLQTEFKNYQKNVLPLHPDNPAKSDAMDEDYEAFDNAKNNFLESLWDVITEHFNNPMKRFEFIVTLSGIGRSADGAWADAVNAFQDDAGMPDEDKTKIVDF